MIAAQRARAEEIFYSALERTTPGERAAFLERACAGDAGLRTLVDRLLAALPRAEKYFPEGGLARLPMAQLAQSFPAAAELAVPAAAHLPPDAILGQKIGPYTLLQRIGEGGCGVVYMAEQAQPVPRRVALKVIKLGMDTKMVIARFAAERQALALMDHPNIARVLDAGATDTGRPYFVMELVRGMKITDFCDAAELDTRQRLRLFMQVCHAIQHAHQKGVIHRDIKPSNILVTIIDGQPVPKVIDFGIAKAIAGRLADSTLFTAYEQFIGTPAYMSPEQAVMSGVDVDTRSDIYSLGVLLYELLTGQTPFKTEELLAQGIDGLRRTLQEQEPQRPSVRVTTMRGLALTQLARLRQAEPLKLISLLRGDLDWIVVRALEKDRARRYETANGLVMDIQRFLVNEPVVARPPSRIYRLQKLVRRNQVACVAGTVVTLTLVGGLAVSTWFWFQEHKALQRAISAEQQARTAEQQQTRLRQEAEDRERITQAAFFISQNRIAEADELVEKVTAIKPSLETESVLRTLGQWHALQGRWTKAAKRFRLLLQADQSDNSWTITGDLLMAGPIQIQCGDIPGYEYFRRAAVARYTGTTDPVFAERTLKISLLLPADASLMKQLQPFSDLAADSLNGENPQDYWTAWRCVSLALMAYRQDQASLAKGWCQKCLLYHDHQTLRLAMAHIIQAMACYQLGAPEVARSELLLGRNLVAAARAGEPGEPGASTWYDGLFARILLREAETLIEKTPAAD